MDIKINVGDTVIVTERHDQNSADVGMIGKLYEIDSSSVPYCVEITYDDGRTINSWCRNVKLVKPTSWQSNVLKFHFV